MLHYCRCLYQHGAVTFFHTTEKSNTADNNTFACFSCSGDTQCVSLRVASCTFAEQLGIFLSWLRLTVVFRTPGWKICHLPPTSTFNVCIYINDKSGPDLCPQAARGRVLFHIDHADSADYHIPACYFSICFDRNPKTFLILLLKLSKAVISMGGLVACFIFWFGVAKNGIVNLKACHVKKQFVSTCRYIRNQDQKGADVARGENTFMPIKTHKQWFQNWKVN